MNEHRSHSVHMGSSNRLVCLKNERESFLVPEYWPNRSTKYLGGIRHSCQECKMNWVLDNIHLRSWACVRVLACTKTIVSGIVEHIGSESTVGFKNATLRRRNIPDN